MLIAFGLEERHQQRVAVGLRLGGGLGADVAARARPVVDDDALAEPLRQRLRDDARRGVDAAARRPGHDQPDRLVRVVLRLAQARRRRQQRRGPTDSHFHGVSSSCLPYSIGWQKERTSAHAHQPCQAALARRQAGHRRLPFHPQLPFRRSRWPIPASTGSASTCSTAASTTPTWCRC